VAALVGVIKRFGKLGAVHRRFRHRSRRGIWDGPLERDLPTDALETVTQASTAGKARR
jgi:hypothetical protein